MMDGRREPIRWSAAGGDMRFAVRSSSGTIAAGWPAAPSIERVAALLATHAAWWSVLAGTSALLLVPLFLVDVPLLDYPNHLARMYVLASGAHDPILSSMYQQHWAVSVQL
jgi:hypothetical protein